MTGLGVALSGVSPTMGLLGEAGSVPNAPDSRRWGRLPGASRARVLREASAALGAGEGSPEDGDTGDTGDTDGSWRRAMLRWAAHVERMGGAVKVGVAKGVGQKNAVFGE